MDLRAPHPVTDLRSASGGIKPTPLVQWPTTPEDNWATEVTAQWAPESPDKVSTQHRDISLTAKL